MAKEVNASKKEPPQNSFVDELAALTYYGLHGTKTKFESLPEAEKDNWRKISGQVMVAIDQMNKMVVVKKETVDVERNREKNIMLMTKIIQEFVSKLKIIKCPKCGASAPVKVQLFPCEELAHRIWNGGNV